VQESAFWAAGDILAIERMRNELRELMKFLDFEEAPIYYTSFTDAVESDVTEFPIVLNYNDLDAYRRKVEQYLKENSSHLTIHKLRNNIQITQSELDELDRMLFEQGNLGSRDEFTRAYGEKPLGAFIRSIVGLDANAAKNAFSTMLEGKTLNAQQIRFMDKVINFFTVKGFIEPSMLFEAPFTDISTSGLVGVFSEGDARKIIEVIERINETAVA